MRRLLTLAFLIAATPLMAEEILKVQVMRDGQILADGLPVSEADLGAQLKALKTQNGMVWFYREGTARTPAPIQLKVFNAILDAGLRISSSTKPDYSDYIGPDGNSHPRK